MKKLFLLLAASSIGLSSWAQQNSFSVMQSGSKLELPAHSDNRVTETSVLSKFGLKFASSTERTTTVHAQANSSWFNYWSQNDQGTSSSVLYYWGTAADSNIYDGTGTTPYHFFCHGLGMSFDPTDAKYYAAANTTPITLAAITDTTSYIVDSFFVPFQYYRYNNADTAADSIIVELVVTTQATDSGTFKLHFGPSAADVAVTPDSTPRFASAMYTRLISNLGTNEVWDSIKALKQRYAFGLHLADTVGGLNALNFALSSPIHVPAKSKVVSFVHFKSMHTTSLGSASGGSTVTNSNYIHLFAGNTEGASSSTVWPQQTPHSAGYAGSFQTGLIAQNQVRYSDTGFTYMGHQMMIPGVAFSAPDLSVSWQAFHVLWTGYMEDAVATVNHTINKVNAFPNPASNSVNVTFNLSNTSDVVITLTNMLGQVVATQTVNSVLSGKATFNTANLATGNYIYTVVANGERTNGRIAIAH